MNFAFSVLVFGANTFTRSQIGFRKVENSVGVFDVFNLD